MQETTITIILNGIVTGVTMLLIFYISYYLKKLEKVVENITKIELYQTENITRIYEILKSHAETINRLNK